ncbi:toxin-antitoxin system, toxin component, HicA domain protein [Streptococcus equinus ATCC 9812]|uniref:Toxin-antitoxin system, toxin component, HicA domain protein n=1 Tax=Streptococcus equinus ATCC 9812 TaxID=525379 RepID=E8JP77_STREI|nr:toxin-antitoxin system, toxin component, HicA domain protein [Streptococcus equinus ATCC 9812]
MTYAHNTYKIKGGRVVVPKTGKELAKIAISKGWKEVRVKGSHHQFKKDGKVYIVTIPIHGNKVVGAGLERKILKDLD